MVHLYIFKIAGIGLVLSTVFLTFSCDVVSGVKFVEKPENVTLDSSWTQLTLNCSIDVATADGMDWKAVIDGESKEICSSISKVCTIESYSVERPNNRTMNLIIRAVNFQNSSVAGNYCCYAENGQGIPACAFVTTVTDFSGSPHTDITEAKYEATTSIATSTDLSTTSSGALSSGQIGGIVGAIIVLIILVILFVVVYRCYRKRQLRRRRNDSEARQSALHQQDL